MMHRTSCLIVFAFLIESAVTQAEYSEPASYRGVRKNIQTDYGLIDDNGQSNQSVVFQRAIDDVAKKGGGVLYVPQGTYRFANVTLRSNLHLLFERGTVIKPYWPPGTKTAVFVLDALRPASKRTMSSDQARQFIENVSLRGAGGSWTIDYSDRARMPGESIRGVLAKMVRNFLIADLDIKDNYTVHCGITLTPLQTPFDVQNWEVSRATDGTVRDCRIFRASPGYGLTQLHGAQSVHFENLYADGGVTLRLETGAVGDKTAIYDITGKNIINENGRCAVMLGPHGAINGVVTIDEVRSISSAFAVTLSLGGVKQQELKLNPDAKDGSFAAGSAIRNITAVFGKTAQIKSHAMLQIPEEYHEDLSLRWEDKFFQGPSIGGVRDLTNGHYRVTIENVTLEGFRHYTEKPILTADDFPAGKWHRAFRAWKTQHGLD